jgi:hypothetical protein
MAEVAASDAAWAAGFFDGEGYTGPRRTKKGVYEYVHLGISQKDPEVLEKFKTIMGVGNIYKMKNRELHSYDVVKRADVDKVLKIMWPYLGTLKKNQAYRMYEEVDAVNRARSKT